MTRTCVIYMQSDKEQQSPWFTSIERATRALAVLRKRYGTAVLYRD